MFPSWRTVGNPHKNATVKSLRILACLTLVLGAATAMRGAAPVHIWEKQEVTLTAARSYANPYTDVIIWVDLSGPGFNKRVYGFWDGGQVFRVRLLATAPGPWSWRSGSSPEDPGLTGKTGGFTAVEWTEDEKRVNPLRRGFLRPTANHHALEHGDGTPFFVIGDTWYSAGTNRFKWYDDDQERPIGHGAGFKDYVRYRKAQGYNWVNIIAAFPNWMNDGKPWHARMPAEPRFAPPGWSSAQAARRTWTTRADGRSCSRGKCPGMNTCSPTWTV